MILKRNPLPLHAQMEQKQRLTNLEKFSSRKNDFFDEFCIEFSNQ
jgi:hypothetical protein